MTMKRLILADPQISLRLKSHLLKSVGVIQLFDSGVLQQHLKPEEWLEAPVLNTSVVN